MTEESRAFETKSVRAIRGREDKTISKWEGEGWELVSRTPGTLQTELHFRRQKPKSRTLLYGLAAGAVAVVLAVIIGIGVATEGDGDEATAVPETAAPAAATSLAVDETTTSEEVSDADAAGTGLAVLTIDSSDDLRQLLVLTDYCDRSIGDSAAESGGRVRGFDASIGAMGPHDGASTRYDVLISAGDFSETEAPGPAFQFRDVNLTSDLHYAGEVPETIGVGTNLHVTAKVVEFEKSSCLFLLEPVETTFR